MGNRPQKGYDYARPGVLAVTLVCPKGIRLCRITQKSYDLLPIGKFVQEGLQKISQFYPQIKIGHYQIMPDHLHMIVHVVKPLPEGKDVRRVIRGFKIGVKHLGEERLVDFQGPVFEEGIFDRPVFTRKLLEREVAYIRENVRRYRLKKMYPTLYRKRFWLKKIDQQEFFRGIGNPFLLDYPRLLSIQYSRKFGEDDWQILRNDLVHEIDRGTVLVSPFLSFCEKHALQLALAKKGKVIHVTNAYLGERYRPTGLLFDPFSQGRVLEVSVSMEYRPYLLLNRDICCRMNKVAEEIAAGMVLRAEDCPQ